MVVEKVFAVIAESTRRDILEALAQESKAVGQLVDELGVSQPTVSKHLRVLREAGVVTMRAQGQKRFYGINTEPLALVAGWLESLGATAPGLSGTAVAPLHTRAPLAGAGHVAAPAAPQPVPATAVPVAAPAAAKEVQPAEKLVPAAANGARVPTSAAQVAGAPAPHASNAATSTAVSTTPAAHAAANGAAGVRATGTIPSSQAAVIVQSNENDGGVPGQISRSVGRAANKAADLLANLPALPTFRRRKD
ncbi:ArsR/SmtB family transcription factor [Arthrobacter glacialis]|uniref:Transcriptional regulator n=1 Tax=Arthrobacter glacialis TaxID=1664 RepID=A0A2S4A157_ARTGL|nr:metalloregulator ArsR/SmtB family transcription factor [Arthrobacter glacialis]POH75213.1 transcriptional regulator [Arthrobacter glacialis]